VQPETRILWTLLIYNTSDMDVCVCVRARTHTHTHRYIALIVTQYADMKCMKCRNFLMDFLSLIHLVMNISLIYILMYPIEMYTLYILYTLKIYSFVLIEKCK